MTHGCQATLYPAALQQVRQRIQRGESFYDTYRLGAIASSLRAFSCFFDERPRVVTKLLPENDRAFVYRESGYYFRSLGRLREAVESYEAALDCLGSQKNAQIEVATVASLLIAATPN